MWCIVVTSIDYDVDLDFLLNSPKTSEKPVNGDESDGSLQHPAQSQSTYDIDCLITPDRRGAAAVDRPTKVPSVDRSTKPSSAVLNNSVADSAVNSSMSAASITRINNKLTSEKNVDLPNSSVSHSLNKSGPDVVERSSIPPAAPDRSTKPVPPPTSSSDVNAHSTKLEKEQAELDILQAKKNQEATALANLMREKRKLEVEVEKKKRLIDTPTRTK